MISCPACGNQNRKGARFCQSCGAPIDSTAAETGGPAASEQSQPTQPLAASSVEPPATEGPLEPGARLKGTYVVQALLAETEGMRTYRASQLEPWRRCAQCGAEGNPDDPFCSECGAQLSNQSVLLQETTGSPLGAALITMLSEEELRRSALPQLVEVFEEQGRRFAVLAEGGASSLTPLSTFFGENTPRLDESDALQIGLLLAQTLQIIHAHELALGRLTMADLGLTLERRVRLTDASALRTSQGPEDQADDLTQLVTVLEQLAGVERRTQRLAEGEAGSSIEGLEDILREIRTGALADAGAVAAAIAGLISEKSTPHPLRTRTGYQTHVGMVRTVNEDSLLTWDLRMVNNSNLLNAGLYIVADGMGGHEGGEIASGIAIATVARVLLPALLDPAMQSAPVDTEQLCALVQDAVQQANSAIVAEAARRKNDMGTTLTMAAVIGDRAIIANVGDSRTYLYRGGTLRRVTQDHSLVMRLVEVGQITEDEIYTHPNRNAILRSLGEPGEVEVDLFEERLQPGDGLFLCSDGLWEMVRNPDILRIIEQSSGGAHDACAALVEAANAGGGEDNIAVVLVRFAAAEGREEVERPAVL